MVQCFVPDCHHESEEKQCRFHVFPEDKTLWTKWILRIRRGDRDPSEFSMVCSCHFQNGDFTKLPGIFQRNAGKVFKFSSPEKKLRRRRRRRQYEEELSETNEDESSNTKISCPRNTRIATLSTSPSSHEVFAAEVSTVASQSSSQTDIGIQTDHIFHPEFYEANIYFKDKEIQELKNEIRRLTLQPFGFFTVKCEEDCLHYTGLSIEMFNIVKVACSIVPLTYYRNSPVKRLTPEDQLFLSLIKLRLNLSFYDIGKRFGVAKATGFNIFFTFLPVLHKIVFQSAMQKLPSRIKCKRSLPPSFKGMYDACRIIIDCTEFRCEIPGDLTEQKRTFSSYKHFNTVKFLFAVSPNACAVYSSDAYPGCTSDKEVFRNCKDLREQLESGDVILADKGFLIHDIVPTDVSVNLPPFLSNGRFDDQEVIEKRNIARARIHIERLNARVKRYKITQFIPKSYFRKINMIVQTCVGLVNFQNPLLKCMSSDFYLSQEESSQFLDEWEL